MGNSSSPPAFFSMLIFTIAFFVSSSSLMVVAMSGDRSLSWLSTEARCHGRSLSECMMDVEFEMDSEINRRILATSSYISYKSLKANNIPCSRRGSSYYNCQPGAEANPYQRGCTVITRCRS
ncbi:protein RALF-like 1 [Cucurbita moschata]|uniref:Protein RALF-like 1 n=1 Tax=Cucurbita moschata TaxID=3662 RepID=A0A6J1F244_CUCMO|nr:protein RALF-like 1 [Cucurbita moschata]